jgi:phosphoglycerate-specific signal transduction histidine kinase
MIPILSFTYFHIDDMNEDQIISYLDKIMNADEKNIQRIYNEYVLFSHENNTLFHDCPIHEIMKKDLIVSHTLSLDKLYTKLLEKYDQSLIDKFILVDDINIRQKLLNIITFAFDKIYKDYSKINILINGYNENNFYKSIPDIIYSILITYFHIMSTKVIDDKLEIITSRWVRDND